MRGKKRNSCSISFFVFAFTYKCKIFTMQLKTVANNDIILLASKGSFKKVCVNRNQFCSFLKFTDDFAFDVID